MLSENLINRYIVQVKVMSRSRVFEKSRKFYELYDYMIVIGEAVKSGLTSVLCYAILGKVNSIIVCHRVEKRKHSLHIVRSLKMCRWMLFIFSREVIICI